MRFFWVKSHIEFAFRSHDHYGSGVKCPSVRNEVFRGVFYTVSYRNLKLSMRFFCFKSHIKFAFRCRDPYGPGVICPWIFYYWTYACNSFPGVFLHRLLEEPETFHEVFWVKSHIEVSFRCRDNYGFRVTCSWIFSYGVYVCNSFPGFFSTPCHIRTWNFPWGFMNQATHQVRVSLSWPLWFWSDVVLDFFLQSDICM
jgi:hypothetical protein